MSSGLKTLLISLVLILGMTAGVSAAEPEETEEPQNPIYFHRMAVAPVLVGRKIPNMNETLDDTLTCPIDQICLDDPSINLNAGSMLMRLIQSVLKNRFGSYMVPMETVKRAYAGLRLNESKDTPRSLAHRLGQELSADLMVVATLWLYRDRGAIQGVPDSPATVAFAIYLVEPKSGRMLWRRIFDESQDYATNDLARFTDRIKMGFKWLTADQLARFGVEQTFKHFPEIVVPAPPGSSLNNAAQ